MSRYGRREVLLWETADRQSALRVAAHSSLGPQLAVRRTEGKSAQGTLAEKWQTQTTRGIVRCNQ